MKQKGFTPHHFSVLNLIRKPLFSNENKSGGGFTIIELLVVIAIIGVLAGTVILSSMRGAAQARDTRRVQELYQIAHGLQQYYVVYNEYPKDKSDTALGCDTLGNGPWDVGNKANEPDDFIKPLLDEEFLNPLPKEWTNIVDRVSGTQCTYRYRKANNPGGCQGTYAILYAACETSRCPTGEKPACSDWDEGSGDYDPYDIVIFLKEK